MRKGQASMLEMKAYLEAVIEARRVDPRDDLITMLVMAEEQGDRLSLDELVIMIIALLVGGNNSTAHLIGNSILTLARHPDSLARLRENPELISTAIEEVLRFESPVQATQPRRPRRHRDRRRNHPRGPRNQPALRLRQSRRKSVSQPRSTRHHTPAEPASHLRARTSLLPRSGNRPSRNSDRRANRGAALPRPRARIRSSRLARRFFVPRSQNAAAPFSSGIVRSGKRARLWLFGSSSG